MSVRDPDPRLDEAKSMPVSDVVDRLGVAGLKRLGGELAGPCPLCGGRDRFAINLRSNAFLCRRCGIRGGDQIALVRQILNLSFLEALEWLCGDRPAAIDPKEMARRRARAEESRRRQEEYAQRARVRARKDARRIWRAAQPATGTLVADYLECRGITKSALPVIPKEIRYLPDHPYVKQADGRSVSMHRGPAMIAVIQDPEGRGSAVHQTWIDLKNSNGKAAIVWQGQNCPAKLVRGSKKGGAIRLHTPPETDTMIVGEGIETTLSALVAQPVPGAAYWCGIDLGNMSGRMQRVPGKRYSGIPDMSDDRAFVPPPWVKRLIFIMDGDSDPAMTRAKLECGLRRAMALRPGLVAQIVEAGRGVDLNDVLRRGAA